MLSVVISKYNDWAPVCTIADTLPRNYSIFFALALSLTPKVQLSTIEKRMVLLPCLQVDGSLKSSNLSSGLHPGATVRSQENTMLACVHVRGPPSDGFS